MASALPSSSLLYVKIDCTTIFKKKTFLNIVITVVTIKMTNPCCRIMSKESVICRRFSQMAAVIHPTGTGKSLIAFKLAEQHPSEKFLWLSPSEYIYQTQVENLGMTFENIRFL